MTFHNQQDILQALTQANQVDVQNWVLSDYTARRNILVLRTGLLPYTRIEHYLLLYKPQYVRLPVYLGEAEFSMEEKDAITAGVPLNGDIGSDNLYVVSVRSAGQKYSVVCENAQFYERRPTAPIMEGGY